MSICYWLIPVFLFSKVSDLSNLQAINLFAESFRE